MDKTKYQLTSNPLWFAPGMVRNYKHARTIKDTAFIQIFESAYPQLSQRTLDKLVLGDYALSDNGETVIVVKD